MKLRSMLVILFIMLLSFIVGEKVAYASSYGYDEANRGGTSEAVIHGWSDILYVGETLTLDITNLGSVASYQWYRSTGHSHINFTGAGYKAPYKVKGHFEEEVTKIPGATGSSYKLTSQDAGYFILCEMKGADGSVFVTDSTVFPIDKRLIGAKIEKHGNSYQVVTEPEGVEVVEIQWYRKGVPYYWKDTGETLAVKITGATDEVYTVCESDTTWLDEYNSAGELTYTPSHYYLEVAILSNGVGRMSAQVRLK